MKIESIEEFKNRGGQVQKVTYTAPQVVGISKYNGTVKYKKARKADLPRLTKESDDKSK